MGVCKRTPTDVYTHSHMHTRTCARRHTHRHTHSHVHSRVCTHGHTLIRVRTHTRTHADARTYTVTHTHEKTITHILSYKYLSQHTSLGQNWFRRFANFTVGFISYNIRAQRNSCLYVMLLTPFLLLILSPPDNVYETPD